MEKFMIQTLRLFVIEPFQWYTEFTEKIYVCHIYKVEKYEIVNIGFPNILNNTNEFSLIPDCSAFLSLW